jgi:hypothetical protein
MMRVNGYTVQSKISTFGTLRECIVNIEVAGEREKIGWVTLLFSLLTPFSFERTVH